MKRFVCFACLIAFSATGFGENKPVPNCASPVLPPNYQKPANLPKNAADFKLVVIAVQNAIDCYNDTLTSDDKGLPDLQTADFDFKTSTSLNAGPSLNFFVFTLGATVEKDDVQDFKLSYGSKSTIAISTAGLTEPPKDFTNELASLIRTAAQAATAQQTALGLKLTTVTVSVQFGIQTNETVGVSFPISFVTAGGKLTHNKNTADTVTLTYVAK